MLWRQCLNLGPAAPTQLKPFRSCIAVPCEYQELNTDEEAGDRELRTVLLDALKASGNTTEIQLGRKLHFDAIHKGLHSNTIVGTALIHMYAKCGFIDESRKVFHRISHPDVISWSALLLGHVINDQPEPALQLLQQMKAQGYTPDARTFVAALMACSKLAAREEPFQLGGRSIKLDSLRKGMEVHAQAAGGGLEAEVFVASALVDMYLNCGSVLDARIVFDRMIVRDVVAWTALLVGYVEHGEDELVLEMFERMPGEGCSPNARTFVAALQACSGMAEREEKGALWCLEKGRLVHAQAMGAGMELEIFVASTLVDMYSRCGSMREAWNVFDRMPHKNVVVWNSIMQGYVENGESQLAVDMFHRMDVLPDVRTYVVVLKAFVSLASEEQGAEVTPGKLVKLQSLRNGMEAHARAVKDSCLCENDLFFGSTLVDLYSNCGSLLDARTAFDRMHRHNVVCWTSLILGCTQNGEPELALELFACMGACQPNARTYVAALMACASLGQKGGAEIRRKGMEIHHEATRLGFVDSDIFVANSVIDMYAKLGELPLARETFDGIACRNSVSWHLLMSAYIEKGENERALGVFEEMKRWGAPNGVSYVTALEACSNLAKLDAGKQIHADVCRSGYESEVQAANSLVDFYGKCGTMALACQCFDSFQVLWSNNLAWNALMAGYSRQGNARELFERMLEETRLQPDEITFMSVLTSCSHAGLVDKGKGLFLSMCMDFRLAPSIAHYTCVIDMLARVNQLDEAVEMVRKMPFQADSVTWTAILAACGKWKNQQVGRLAFQTLVELNENKASPYLLMANVYN